MNWQHLKTILWLRWRMSLNQLRRGGIASKVILAILGVLAIGAAVSTFLLALLIGILTLPRAPAELVMYIWDGVVVGFLFFWMIGLVAELQRSEVLSLQKLLHLPVSLTGTFIINYVGSLLSLSLVVFLPGMIGLCIALVFAKGPAMLMLFPLLAGFLLMVTALTYQFQGWLATLMTNKRRRRTIIAAVTVFFVLIAQLPNLLNVAFRRGESHQDGVPRQLPDNLERIVTRTNLIVPLGWLPYGAMACAQGNVVPAILTTIGAGMIGAASLWRSYRTTLRLYTGHFTSGTARRVLVARGPEAATVKTSATSASLLERHLPGLSEHASAVALANFRSLTRAPEAKMLLLSPVIMVVVFGSMLLTRSVQPPEIARPFMGFGVVAMILLSMMQLLGNQFGLDRDGFRVLVLSASSRRDILLGKNLSIAPLALCLGTVAVTVLQAVYPMRIAHFLATLAELGLTYLILCLIGNFSSILAPMPVASGSLRPAHPKAVAVLVHLLFGFVLLPLVFSLALIPLGVELLLHNLGWWSAIPIYMICSMLELVMVIGIYQVVLTWQGRLLQAREQNILAVVTTRVE